MQISVFFEVTTAILRSFDNVVITSTFYIWKLENFKLPTLELTYLKIKVEIPMPINNGMRMKTYFTGSSL